MGQPDTLYGRPFNPFPEHILKRAREYMIEFSMPQMKEDMEKYQPSIDLMRAGEMDDYPMILFSAYTMMRERDMVDGVPRLVV